MKEICIINYPTSASIYGVGTHMREYIYCLENMGCKINRIELGADKFHIKKNGKNKDIYIPYLKNASSHKYNKGICRLLRLYIEDSDNLVFHFHYTQSSNLLDNIKKYFPLSNSIFTIHYFNWSWHLQGNHLLFEKIIRGQANKKIKKKYQQIISDYEKEKVLFAKVDHIVCLSEDTFDLVQDLYGIKKNVWLIPNGLRRQFQNVSETQKINIREKYDINIEEKILLFVGRIDPAKGIYSLLSCFDKVLADYPNCQLIVIGEGDINGIVKKCRKIRAKVIFLGRLEKKTVYQWYQIADIALFPSFGEQSSYVGIEMMMHGLPVIASDGYGVKNMFHDGLNAKIAKIENVNNLSKFEENLKESILYALRSDLSELEKGAKKNIFIKI